MKSYWDSLAHQFQHQQPPLRPCPEDTHLLYELVHRWNRQNAQSYNRVLLFGVTPEIANLSWPGHTSLLAVEKSQAMIDVIWPGNISGRREARLGNWLEIQLDQTSFEFIVGDGFLTGFGYPDQYRQIVERIYGWLRPNGLFIARLFIRTGKKESLQAITADLQAGQIKRFDILKWRLGMALQQNVHQGVMLNDIFRAWRQIEQQWPSLPEEAGWPRRNVDTIKLYEGRTECYAFPSIEELHDAFSKYLEPVSVTIPKYDFGQCCPTLVYRPRQIHLGNVQTTNVPVLDADF